MICATLHLRLEWEVVVRTCGGEWLAAEGQRFLGRVRRRHAGMGLFLRAEDAGCG
jgi:hypothetical protein